MASAATEAPKPSGELESWKTPAPVEVLPVPEVGHKGPNSSSIPMPPANGKPSVITFLRHCGCPFAEKTFRQLTALSAKHPEVNFYAVSHSAASDTEDWVIACGGEWSVTVVTNPDRTLYGQWGLGTSSTWHVLSPWSLWGVYKLGKGEGIWNRPTNSGTRWQTAGSFAVDGEGVVRWVRVAQSADDMPDFREALKAVGVDASRDKIPRK